MTRRELLKRMATTAALSAAEAVFPGIVFATSHDRALAPSAVEWKKTPCRFCGVGCGLLVGVNGGGAGAGKGDPPRPRKQGALCGEGYHRLLARYTQGRATPGLG